MQPANAGAGTLGIEQINQAITQMDDVTQQNAALVEEAAAAANSLEDQAASLAQLVSVFKLNGGGGERYGVAARAFGDSRVRQFPGHSGWLYSDCSAEIAEPQPVPVKRAYP
jgi:hypothetical protein